MTDERWSPTQAAEIDAIKTVILCGGGAAEYVRIFEAMRTALQPFASLGLWEDNYSEGSEERAEAEASDERLDVWVRPSQVRAARVALAGADKVRR